MGTTLSTLKPPAGARRKRKRVGRGPGSGRGKTSARGHKGQNSRSGGGVHRGFEGGQMPLQRQVPKRGFKNIFAVTVDEVNLDVLERSFDAGELTPEMMRARGVVPRKAEIIKVLGRGEITKKFVVKAHRFSASAQAKIEAAGGSVEIIPEKVAAPTKVKKPAKVAPPPPPAPAAAAPEPPPVAEVKAEEPVKTKAEAPAEPIADTPDTDGDNTPKESE